MGPADLPSASHGHQLGSAQAAPSPDPPASSTAPALKPESGIGGETFSQTVGSQLPG